MEIKLYFEEMGASSEEVNGLKSLNGIHHIFIIYRILKLISKPSKTKSLR